jgi:prolyl 4-hydroxylase
MNSQFSACRARRERPRIYVMDGFATLEECRHLRDLGADARRLARWGVTAKHDRTGFSFELPLAKDPTAAAISERICAALGIVNGLPGSLRFRRYAAGEAHPPHTDNFRIGELDLVATALVALDSPEQGGETAFPRADPPLAVAPRAGRLLVWLNNGPDGRPDGRAYHEGRPVLRGTKTTVTEFVYAEPGACQLLVRGPLAWATS